MITVDSIEPTVSCVLRQSPFSALHSLEVSQHGEAVVLTGRVGSYYYKQLAQEAVLSVVRGREVVNNICVTKNRRSI